ncbi:MAG: DUF4340 domain-containing protein [Dehalococcoidia bacterium]
MNLRLTIPVLILLLVFSGYLILRTPFEETKEPDSEIASLAWFYLVDETKIDNIKVSYFDQEVSFYRDSERTWRIDSIEGDPVNSEFRGTPFLAGGAKSPRIISTDKDPELSQYGLDDPKLKIFVRLESSDSSPQGITYTVLIGDMTPDGVNNYSAIEGHPEIYLLDGMWGQHMARLATETSLVQQ